MNKTTIAYTGVLVVAMLLTWISVAYAETYDVEISDTGFSPTTIHMNSTDTVRFVSTTDFTWIISNPFDGGTNHVSNNGRIYNVDSCGTYSFMHYEGYDIPLGNTFILTIDCPQPEVVEVVPTNSTSTTPDDYGEVETIDVTTATPYTENGDPIINGEPQVEDETPINRDYESASNETLGLRLQILTVLESILSIIFGK